MVFYTSISFMIQPESNSFHPCCTPGRNQHFLVPGQQFMQDIAEALGVEFAYRQPYIPAGQGANQGVLHRAVAVY